MVNVNEYSITRDYIPVGNSRPGIKNEGIRFLVSHDTGNAGSTAYNNRTFFAKNPYNASAHTLIDDQYILEIIPLEEKAWHVRYEVTVDNHIYGNDANDIAIGIELCWGGTINFEETYKRYVWYHAYLLDRFQLDSEKDIISHQRLDPTRRSDPNNALNRYGITWATFITDVKNTYQETNKNITHKNPSIFKYGDSGPKVKQIQQYLINTEIPLTKYGADGIYGSETVQGVMTFQRKYGLKVDGIVGPITLSVLKQFVENPTLRDNISHLTRPYPGHYIQMGNRGSDVKAIQKVVGVTPDGIFGPITETAVKAYQKRNSLRVDGLVGPKTWNVMF
jgi:N-acetylmuramoyl-L-alanine amidase